jgi:hypothetical protein
MFAITVTAARAPSRQAQAGPPAPPAAAAVVLRRRAAAATARLPAIAFVAYRVQAWASVRKPLSRGMAMGRPAHWRSRSAQQGLVSRPSAKYFRSAACFGCLSPGPAGVG